MGSHQSRLQVHPIRGMGVACRRPMVVGQVDRRENLAVVIEGWVIAERPLGCERIITQPVKQVTYGSSVPWSAVNR